MNRVNTLITLNGDSFITLAIYHQYWKAATYIKAFVWIPSNMCHMPADENRMISFIHITNGLNQHLWWL